MNEDCQVNRVWSTRGEDLREMSMMSLKKLINQMKEEILWTEAHQAGRG